MKLHAFQRDIKWINCDVLLVSDYGEMRFLLSTVLWCSVDCEWIKWNAECREKRICKCEKNFKHCVHRKMTHEKTLKYFSVFTWSFDIKSFDNQSWLHSKQCHMRNFYVQTVKLSLTILKNQNFSAFHFQHSSSTLSILIMSIYHITALWYITMLINTVEFNFFPSNLNLPTTHKITINIIQRWCFQWAFIVMK